MASSSCSSSFSRKPNWLELPRELTANILQRLGTVDILANARNVCPCWWNICKDFRKNNTTIDMSDTYFSLNDHQLEKICRHAIDQSCGHLNEIYIKNFGTNDLLQHITNSACRLRCISLEGCPDISLGVFIEFVKKQPLLEELSIIHSFQIEVGSFETIAEFCPLLKSLEYCVYNDSHCEPDSVIYDIANAMSGLRHLAILNHGISDDGLLAILDECCLLESLDLRGCIDLDLDGSLGERCYDEIKELRHPNKRFNHSCKVCEYGNLVLFSELCNSMEMFRNLNELMNSTEDSDKSGYSDDDL